MLSVLLIIIIKQIKHNKTLKLYINKLQNLDLYKSSDRFENRQ